MNNNNNNNNTTVQKLTLNDVARLERPCDPAQEWAAAQPDQSLGALWLACPRADWSLWLARVAGVATGPIGYWCAEQARQTALQVLTAAGVACEALRGCAPIVDASTARAAAAEAAMVAEAAARAAVVVTAVVVATGRAARAAWAAEAADAVGAAWATRPWAWVAEHQTIADYVRTQVTYAQIETGLRARLGA